MHYKKATIWIFVLLLFLIALMILFPNAYTIGLGTVGVPVIVLYQAYIILNAKDESRHSFRDRWYDDP